jgi:asparagine N-glycosylation enzyme membrane subunit Stt3
LIDWIRKNKIEIIILVVAGTLVSLGCYLQTFGWRMTFHDTDDYMRLVRTREFFKNYDLSNAIISRSNVPFGCDLHWTRFYDFFIIVPTYILNLFIDSIDKSIEYVCFFISPVMKSATIAIFFSVVQKLMKKDDAFFARRFLPPIRWSCSLEISDDRIITLVECCLSLFICAL